VTGVDAAEGGRCSIQDRPGPVPSARRFSPGWLAEAVWAALNDAAILKQCIPGCQSLEKLSDTEMTAVVKVGIGAAARL
jgi:Carbon monoxide dehydrogenase subunit G (CoxG)